MERANHKIIILTGVDRCGKSSIWQEINKQTHYKHFIMDRFTEGFLTYKHLFNKPDNICNPKELEFMESKMREMPHLLVYLDCDADEIRERCKKTGHELYNVELHQNIYEMYFEQSSLNKVRISTTGKTPEKVVQELIQLGLL